jgi:hypothetical protein
MCCYTRVQVINVPIIIIAYTKGINYALTAGNWMTEAYIKRYLFPPRNTTLIYDQ